MKIITDLTPTPETQEIIYNALDTMQTMRLKEMFEAGVIPEWATETYKYSEKMLGPIMTMMRRGVRIDLTKRDEVVKKLEARAQLLNKTFDDLCVSLFDTTINCNSDPQMKALFYTFLGIPEQIKTKKGESKISTDAQTLEKIAREYPRGAVFANIILRIRELEKQVEFLTKTLSPAGRFHTSYNIGGTETFRLSSSEHPLRIGCLPDTAEALTPTGWLPIKDKPETIVQWNPQTNELTYTKATWNFQKYYGSLLSYSGRCVRGDFTSNHRVPTFSSRGKFHTKTASRVAKYTSISTPVSGIIFGGKAVDPSWVRKLVMLSADGNEYAAGKWRIKFKKKRKNIRCAFVLGKEPSTLRSYGYYDYCVTDAPSITKKFPNILEWDYPSRQAFFDELQHWDAHVRKDSFIYYTTIPENADMVATAAHITGLSASIIVNHDNSNKYGNTATKPLYSVNISKKTTNKLEAKRWTTTQFGGNVGCPTVENGYWLVRYNGGIYITGNSNQQNIPRDDDCRAAYTSDPGYLFFQADQQGAEARLVAYRSGDEDYINACESGDAHTMVAAMVFGFEPIRELAEREFKKNKSFRQAAKSGSHGCVTEDHEVFTPTGWVSIKTEPPVIAQWSPVNGGTITWAPVDNWLCKQTTALVSIEGPSISFLGTEDHKIIVNNDGRWVERTAGTIKRSDRIPYTGTWESGHIHEPARACVVAAYQADGNYNGKNIRFKFRRERKILRMRKLLAEAHIAHSETTYGKDTVFSLNAMSSKNIAAYGKKASPTLLRWDTYTLAAFVDETVYWDGTIGKSNRRAVCSVDLEHCQNLQTLYQFMGYGSKVIDNTDKTRTNAFGTQRPHWVSMNRRKFASVSSCAVILHNVLPTWVYCPTVATGYFMVRRKGHIYVTGNSNYMGKPYTLAQQMGVDQDAAEQFQTNYFKRFPKILEWHIHTAQQIQTKGWLENPFGMRRTFWGRRWDDATIREAIAYYPQSAVGVLTNIILYKLWLKYEGRADAPIQILMNGHDAVIGQLRADQADTLIPELLEEMRFPFPITDISGKVREVVIPFDMEVGSNWGKYNEKTNPNGLKKWKPKA